MPAWSSLERYRYLADICISLISVGVGLAREAFGVIEDAFADKPCSYKG